MNTERPEPGLRESQLLRALAEQAAPRPVSWWMISGLVCAGSLTLILLVNTVGALQSRPRVDLEEPVDQALLQAAVAAYKRADWDTASRLFGTLHRRFPDNTRSEDYLDRIDLTRRDAEILARAEEALVAGQPERARELTEQVAPNAPLFAQAEGLNRSALAQLASHAEAPARAARGEGAVDVRAALGEALALYEDEKFEEAMTRAQGLAQRASGPARDELLAWAGDAAQFGKLYPQVRPLLEASGPAADQALLAGLESLEQAVELDERLSEGRYARSLRLRGAQALIQRASSFAQNGQLVEACSELAKAHTFAGRAVTAREGNNMGLARRCEAEAMRRIGQARVLERKKPFKAGDRLVHHQAATALYQQALTLSVPGSPAHVAAEQGLSR